MRAWHQDWWAWDERTLSLDERPPQIGCMHYLDRTTIENGALRVLPGSHRNKFPQVHDHYFDGSMTVRPYPEQVPIETSPGDLLLVDARLLHSTYANTTDQNRIGVTIWWLPRFDQLPPALRALARAGTSPDTRKALGESPLPPPPPPEKDLPPYAVSNDTYRPSF